MTHNSDIATFNRIENDRELHRIVEENNGNESCVDIITTHIVPVLDAVLIERQQLIEKGSDATLDDGDTLGTLARIATYYALCGARQRQQGFDHSDAPEDQNRIESERQSVHASVDYNIGPLATLKIEYSPRENLVRAAAFILAEIECVDCESTVSASTHDDGECYEGVAHARVPLSLKAVLIEYQHQIESGCDAADDSDTPGNHAQAAAYYAFCAYWQRRKWNTNFDGLDEHECIEKERLSAIDCANFDIGYPWAHKTPDVKGSARENLVRAAALILAEIDRIDREKEATA